ncbi:TIGR03943 family putative permease subunit [Amycolatopsis anabasis]|uniref:TIGR03943 family putative permease subunit n=1 Tax=Amycolatopsis anabasis TaxID=1840409 RepID=UPI00131C3539|nr:TIGR03943 family protein [Amycolatopsis anabasis]
MRRETQNILLILLGGALLKIALNGDYLRYVRPAHQPWVIGGGAVMLALGAIAIVRDVLAARRAAAADPLDHGHDHGAHSARSAWLLMVPVLAVFLIAPPALGSDSVARSQARLPSSSAQALDAQAFPPLPPGDVVPLSVSVFVTRAGWDSTGSLNGRTVSLSGFVVHSGGSTLLARMVISCCAADARPQTVRLDGPGVAALPADTWIEAVGQVVPGSSTRENGMTPTLTLSNVRRVPAPEDPYEY